MYRLSNPTNNYLLGVISDTHGLLRSSAIKALEGADVIIHAGDIGRAEILKVLQTIAPVVAVRGNMDRGEWAGHLPETEVVQIGELLLYVLHDINDLDLDPEAVGFKAVISGHSHQPLMDQRSSALFLNPGSAGPRRLSLPVTVATLRIWDTSLEAQVVRLEES